MVIDDNINCYGNLYHFRGCQNVYVVDPQGGLAVIRVWGGLQVYCLTNYNLLYKNNTFVKQNVHILKSPRQTFSF